MKFTVDKREKYIIFTIEEEKLTSLLAPKVKSEIVMLHSEGARNIIFDMKPVKYVDSSGLSAILTTERLCKNANGSFVLCEVQDTVLKLLKISQLDTIMHIVPTLHEATELVIMEELERELRGDE